MDYDYNYSFIIPHKNIPDLLTRCVSSIPRRKDVQIIIIDDNSDPDVVNFEQFPFMEDPAVDIVFDKSGLGAGHARNLGLEKARGKWLIFADADDFFLYSIRQMLDDYIESEADLIFFQSISLDSDTYQLARELRSGGNMYVNELLRGIEGAEDILRFCHHVPWCKIVRSQVVEKNKIRFDEIKRCNDTHFSYLVGHYAKNIKGDKRAAYCVTDRANSTVKNPTAEKESLVNRVFTEELEFMNNNGYSKSRAYNIHYNAVIDSLLKIQKKDKDLYNEAVLRLEKLNVPRKKIENEVLKLTFRRKIGNVLARFHRR